MNPNSLQQIDLIQVADLFQNPIRSYHLIVQFTAQLFCFLVLCRNLYKVSNIKVRFSLVLVCLLCYRFLSLFDVLIGNLLSRFQAPCVFLCFLPKQFLLDGLQSYRPVLVEACIQQITYFQLYQCKTYKVIRQCSRRVVYYKQQL